MSANTIKPYRFEYCMICHKQLIVRNIDGWTGKELPNDAPYVCDNCKRKQEKQHALMFANYATQSKCKRSSVLPCEICKAIYSEKNVLPCEICKAKYSDCEGYE